MEKCEGEQWRNTKGEERKDEGEYEKRREKRRNRRGGRGGRGVRYGNKKEGERNLFGRNRK